MTKQPLLMTTLLCSLFVGNVAIAKPPADDLLAGPAMQDEEVTKEDMVLEAQRVRGITINHDKKQKFWMATLKTIELTQEQQDAVQSLIREYEIQEKEFHRSHGKEVAALRKEMSVARKAGGEVSKETQKRLRELMEMAPNPIPYQERAWSVLTADQQSTFKQRYQERIDNAMKERGKKDGKLHPMMEERMQERGFGPEDSPFRDKRIDLRDDPYEREEDALDAASLRRIKFLRRLQQLKQE